MRCLTFSLVFFAPHCPFLCLIILSSRARRSVFSYLSMVNRDYRNTVSGVTSVIDDRVNTDIYI